MSKRENEKKQPLKRILEFTGVTIILFLFLAATKSQIGFTVVLCIFSGLSIIYGVYIYIQNKAQKTTNTKLLVVLISLSVISLIGLLFVIMENKAQEQQIQARISEEVDQRIKEYQETEQAEKEHFQKQITILEERNKTIEEQNEQMKTLIKKLEKKIPKASKK